jgi:hypothetical protein
LHGSLWRFYALFAIAFTLYSVGWIIGWMALRGNVGSLAGLFLGTVAMGWLLVKAFDSRNEFLKIVVALFVLNAIGYFAGLGGGLRGRDAGRPAAWLRRDEAGAHESGDAAMGCVLRARTWCWPGGWRFTAASRACVPC